MFDIRRYRSAGVVAAILVMAVATFFVAYQVSAAAPMSLTGKVLSIDNAAKTLTVQSESHGKLAFGWDEGIKVMKCDKAVAFKEIKRGDKVTISYNEMGGKYVAENIKLLEKNC